MLEALVRTLEFPQVTDFGMELQIQMLQAFSSRGSRPSSLITEPSKSWLFIGSRFFWGIFVFFGFFGVFFGFYVRGCCKNCKNHKDETNAEAAIGLFWVYFLVLPSWSCRPCNRAHAFSYDPIASCALGF